MTNAKHYAAELVDYFERTRFLEILRAFLIQIGLHRPLSVKHYVRRYLRKIANAVLTKNAIVHLPPEINVKKFAKECSKMYHIPTIAYNTRGKKVELDALLKKFEKFCRVNGISKKNKIYLNIPRDLDEVVQIEYCQSPPTNFIQVSTDQTEVNDDIKKVLGFYKNKSKIVCAPSGIKNAEKTIIPEVMYKIKYSPKTVSYDIGAHFLYRVVIIGRRGSGRKTQAKLLAKRYNLVYISIDLLIRETLTSKDNMAKVLCAAYKKDKRFSSSAIIALLWKRILSNDALSRGWVIVGFPNCIDELRTLMEKLRTPPNGFVVLHCSSDIAIRRLVKKWECCNYISRNIDTTDHVEQGYAQYDQQKLCIYNYLKTLATKTIHVDATCCIKFVRNKIFALLMREVYEK